MEAGFWVSKKNVQICERQLKYLGFNIIWGQRMLGTERKQAVCANATPTIHQKVHELLGAAGFCRIWISVFSDLARPLHEALEREEKAPLEWEPRGSISNNKAKVSDASALELPNITRAFNLCGHEKYKMALRVLTQKFRLRQRPVATCLNRWPPYLQAIAATTLLVSEVDKLMLGQNLNVKAIHSVVTLMDSRCHHWLTHARITQYQGLLWEHPRYNCKLYEL